MGIFELLDFGEASQQYVADESRTPGFIAPEVLFKEKKDVVDAFAADVYSIAVIWHCIFFRKFYVPEEDRNDEHAYDMLPLEMPGTVPKLDEAMEDLFYGMAHPDPKERISIDQALKHKYFEMLADL